MNGSDVLGSGERSRVLNALRLEKAVLCAECDVVSDSHRMMSAWCVAATLYSTLLEFSAATFLRNERGLIAREAVEISSREVVLPFPKPHRLRRMATAGSRQVTVISFSESEADEFEREGQIVPKAR